MSLASRVLRLQSLLHLRQKSRTQEKSISSRGVSHVVIARYVSHFCTSINFPRANPVLFALVGRHLLTVGLDGLEGVVYLDDADRKMIVTRSGGMRPLLLADCHVPPDLRFTFYDQVHTTGTPQHLNELVLPCCCRSRRRSLCCRSRRHGCFCCSAICVGSTRMIRS